MTSGTSRDLPGSERLEVVKIANPGSEGIPALEGLLAMPWCHPSNPGSEGILPSKADWRCPGAVTHAFPGSERIEVARNAVPWSEGILPSKAYSRGTSRLLCPRYLLCFLW
ncbi:MAG: hypothetical protein OXR72_11060 [Gemmatimonadota bacterium]|nr:hypothetical protein [Gemmatimonadota bacterium]